MTRVLLATAALLALCGVAQADEPAASSAKAIFKIDVTDGAAKLGEPATVAVVVTGLNGFKANAEYPNKIKEISTDDGASVAQSDVAGTVKDGQLSYVIQAVPKTAGDHALRGKIRFSVCDDKVCKVKSAELSGKVVGLADAAQP